MAVAVSNIDAISQTVSLHILCETVRGKEKDASGCLSGEDSVSWSRGRERVGYNRLQFSLHECNSSIHGQARRGVLMKPRWGW
jgi:hypothetical protein